MWIQTYVRSTAQNVQSANEIFRKNFVSLKDIEELSCKENFPQGEVYLHDMNTIKSAEMIVHGDPYQRNPFAR